MQIHAHAHTFHHAAANRPPVSECKLGGKGLDDNSRSSRMTLPIMAATSGFEVSCVGSFGGFQAVFWLGFSNRSKREPENSAQVYFQSPRLRWSFQDQGSILGSFI